MTAATAAALASFDHGDVTVASSLVHLHARLDRAGLLVLRSAGAEGARQARKRVAPLGSAILLERFVAEAFAAAGAHADALAVRLEALAVTPRWDSALAARILAGAADTLVALGRADEALALGERALRFMPAEPRVVVSYASALEAAGRTDDAAACHAWLHDIGVGAVVLPRDASEREREIEAYLPDLARLEPLDDEGMARHLTFTYADLGLVNHMLQGRRHAMACLRHGTMDHAARRTLEGYAGGTPSAIDAGHWLGWPVGATDYVATDALLASVERRLAATKRERTDLDHRSASVRAAAVDALVLRGEAALAREGLFDHTAYVRFRAAAALRSDPLVSRVKAAEATLDPSLRLFSRDAPPDGIEVSLAHHGGTRFLEDGAEITYPEPDRRGGPFDLHAPHIERAATARGKCKICKAPIAAGELRLRVRQKSFPVETFYTHLGCAAGGERGPLRASTKLQREGDPLLLVALRRSRLAIPERDALMAQLGPSQRA